MIDEKYRVKLKDWKKIDNYLKKHGNICWFANFPVLYLFLNSNNKRLFFYKNSLIFIKEKEGISDCRILFSENKEVVEELKQKADFIGCSFTDELPGSELSYTENEFVVDNESIINMKGKFFSSIRRSYNYFKRNYPSLKIENASIKHKDKIKEFLLGWAKEMKKLGKHADYSLELLFLESFLENEKIPGTVIIYGNKIVGIEFHTICPFNKDIGVGIFKKNLREYNGIGDYLTVIMSGKLLKEGAKYNNIGVANNKELEYFKVKFMKEGFINKRHHFSIYSSNKLKNIDENFLRKFWH